MRTVLFKDCIQLKKMMILILLLYPVLVLVDMTILSFDPQSKVLIIALVSVITVLFSVSKENENGWSLFITTIPIKRSSIIAAKFIELGIALIYIGIIQFITVLIDSRGSSINDFFGILLLVIYLFSVVTPIYFYLGSHQARRTAVFAALFLGIILWALALGKPALNLYLLPMVMALVLILSYFATWFLYKLRKY